jgi:carbonic anhydrase/acetyltransferase-like protein (isoleucine patch superfamily)
MIKDINPFSGKAKSPIPMVCWVILIVILTSIMWSTIGKGAAIGKGAELPKNPSPPEATLFPGDDDAVVVNDRHLELLSAMAERIRQEERIRNEISKRRARCYRMRLRGG